MAPLPKAKSQQLSDAFRIKSNSSLQPTEYCTNSSATILKLILLSVFIPHLYCPLIPLAPAKMSHWNHTSPPPCFYLHLFLTTTTIPSFYGHSLPILSELLQMPLPPGSIPRLPRQKYSPSSDLIVFTGASFMAV